MSLFTRKDVRALEARVSALENAFDQFADDIAEHFGFMVTGYRAFGSMEVRKHSPRYLAREQDKKTVVRGKLTKAPK